MALLSKPESYCEGCNPKLLNALPEGKRAGLELGCANGELVRACKSMNPDCVWTGLDVNEASLALASRKQDKALNFDLNHCTDEAFQTQGSFDPIVFGDLIEHALEPERRVCNLQEVTLPDASTASAASRT